MKKNSKRWRTLSATALIIILCLSLALHTGIGTPSQWGIYDIAAICPLGALESFLASKTIVPAGLIGLALVVVFILIFGRAFCAWGCPVPLLRRVFGVKEPRYDDNKQQTTDSSKIKALTKQKDFASKKKHAAMLAIPASLRGGALDSRNWVLGGALLSTALFGFPVFCLICPIGLSFATIIALWHLFQFAETTWSLLLFPAILLVEILFLRKWCHRFCPLGALASLVARGNRTLRPTSNPQACLLTSKKMPCAKCTQACPEGINLHKALESAPLSECTRCRACVDVCPAGAISFPLISKKTNTTSSEQ